MGQQAGGFTLLAILPDPPFVPVPGHFPENMATSRTPGSSGAQGLAVYGGGIPGQAQHRLGLHIQPAEYVMQRGHARGLFPVVARPQWRTGFWHRCMAHTDRARTAGNGWRTPLGFLGSSIWLRAPSKPGPQSPTLSSHTTVLHTPKTLAPIIQHPVLSFLQLKDPVWMVGVVSGVGFLLQNHYPRFKGAPSCHFRTLTRRPHSVDSG